MTDFKSWIRAAFVKAIKATAQTMIAAIPVGPRSERCRGAIV